MVIMSLDPTTCNIIIIIVTSNMGVGVGVHLCVYP